MKMRFLPAIWFLAPIAAAPLLILPASAESGGDTFVVGCGTGRGLVYVEQLEWQIDKVWEPPKGKEWKDLVVEVKIRRDGTLSQLKTIRTSLSPEIDALAIESIQKAKPFPGLPTGFPSATFELHFASPGDSGNTRLPKAGDCRDKQPRLLGTAGDSSPPAVAHKACLDTYLINTLPRIAVTLEPISRPESKTAVVAFKIHANGAISHLCMERSSGDAAVDEAALKAVRQTSPMPALPPDGSKESIDIQCSIRQAGTMGDEKEGDAWVGWIYGPHDPRRIGPFPSLD
jgi:TonB family protein